MQPPAFEVVVSVAGIELLRRTLRPGDYVIGHEAGCELRIEAGQVSARHAQLIVNFDHALVEDLGSETGTLINGKPVLTATRLWPNQKVQAGDATIELRRVRTILQPGASLAPGTETVKRLLPEEILREKKYEIGGVVAQGGMGAILDARETATERTVAMKVMLDNSNPTDLTRFVAEARVTAQLEHPNIVPVHELSLDENEQVYYTMKYVQGTTLRKVLKGLAAGDREMLAKYPLPALLTIFQKVCDAMAFAHSKGVIHRDLKPENLMLGDFGEVLVMDWGLAKVLGGKGDGPAPPPKAGVGPETGEPDDEETFGRTIQGSILGTPQYMAPEQAEGRIEDLDARSDIFSLGGVLYSILTLRPPIEGKSLQEVLQKVITGRITSPSAISAPAAAPRRAAPAPPTKAPPTKPAPPQSVESYDPLAPTMNTASAAREPAPPPAPEKPREVLPASQIRPLPHIPGGRVPAALSAVTMKALSLRPQDRYQSVAELSADLAAYQQGFATRAENASLAQQIILLIRRNRGIFATGLSAWLIITALAAWFIIHLRASERETRRQAEIARAEAGRATTAEGAAVQEKEATRESLARAALNLAEAAQREANGPEMQAALNEVPADLRDSTWDYLYEQSDTSIARLQVINGVAADPTRPGVFALAGPNHGISIMDVRTGATSLEFTAGLKKASGTLRIGFSADGERIAVATAGTAGGIVIHSARDGRKLMEWDAPPVDAICFSPDGKLLQTEGVGANQIHVWDAVEGKLAWSWPPEPGGAVHGAFTPDGQRVVTVDSKESFRLVNARDGTLLRALPPIRATIRTLVMNPDGSVTAAGDHGVVVRFASGDGHVLTDFRTGGSRVDHLGVTPDGERIVTVAVLPDGRQEIRLWATGTGLAVQALLGGSGEIKKIAVHPLSGELVVGGTNARAWSLVGTPAKWTLPGVTGTRAAFLGADDVIFAHSGLVKLQAAGASTEHKLPGQYRRAAISADGHRAAIMIRAMNPILLLRDPGTAAEQIAAFQPKNDLISVSLNPAGARLAAIERTNATIEWWDTASGQRGADLEREDIKRIQDARWLDGERLLALVTARQERGNPGSEEQVIVWDTTTGKILRTVTNRTVMNALALAPDGRRFAEAGADRKVRIRDTATLAVLQEFRAHDGPIVALAWHPSRPILASASTDLSIRIWNLETGRRLEELRGPLDEPNALSFSPGGRRLACSAQDGVTHIWEPNSLQEQPAAPPKAGDWEDLLAPLTPEFVAQTGHGWRMDNGAVFSPDNRAATLPLPGNYAGASYQVRIGLRRIDPKNVLQIILPVGGRAVGFALDGYASSFTGLSRVHNAEVKDLPGAVQGPQVTDAERHELELTVRIDAASAKITARLDGRPLYEWAGPIAELSVNDRWPAPPPGALALGAAAADWVVYEVQAKRLAP